MATQTEEPKFKNSFQEAYLKAMATDPDKPPVDKVTEKPKEKEVEAPKSKVLDALFKKPEAVTEKPLETAITVESEVEKIAEPEFKSPKAKEGWTQLKAKALELEKAKHESDGKIAEFEKKIAEAEAKGNNTDALNAKLAEAEKYAASLAEVVMRADAEAKPDFQERLKSRNSIVERTKKLFEDNRIESSEIETALGLKGQARFDALKIVSEDLPAFSHGQLGSLLMDLDRVDSEIGVIRSDHAKYAQEQDQREKEQSENQRREFATKASRAFDETERELARELEVLMPLDGHDDWNHKGKEALAKARAHFDTNRDIRSAAKVSILAQTAPIYRELYIAERGSSAAKDAEIEKLKADLEKSYGTSPRVSGGGDAGASKKKMSFLEKYTQVTGGEA